MSKIPSSLSLLAIVSTSLLLSACGGGGNESGDPVEISASPAAVLVNGATGCYVGTGPTVFLFGGTPPYKLRNSAPQAMVLDKTQVKLSGEGFTVTFINGMCLDNIPVSVEDDMGKVLAVGFTNQPPDTTTSSAINTPSN